MAHRTPLAVDAARKVWYRPTALASNARPTAHIPMEPIPQQPLGTWEQLLFSAAPCGLVFLDRQAIVRLLNPCAANLLGLDPGEAIGKPLTAVLPDWKDTPLHASLPSLLDAQSTFETMEFDVSGPQEKTLRVWAAHVPNGGQSARGVLLSIMECTEVSTLERRLHRAEHQAAIGKLARGIAHELNSPLDGVLRYTYLALEHLTEDSPVREYLVHVKEGLDRMVRVVKAFLEFSRQVTTPVNRVANLNQLVEDAFLLVHHRAKFQQVRIVKHFGENLPAVLDAGLQHAIVNLIKNAFDAMPRGGTLTITTRATEEHVHVDIEDTGAGIPEDVQPRIFEPFFSTKPIHQGSGLGLIIAKEVMERSGGSLEFESQNGVGTVFHMHVPIAPTEASEHGA